MFEKRHVRKIVQGQVYDTQEATYVTSYYPGTRLYLSQSGAWFEVRGETIMPVPAEEAFDALCRSNQIEVIDHYFPGKLAKQLTPRRKNRPDGKRDVRQILNGQVYDTAVATFVAEEKYFCNDQNADFHVKRYGDTVYVTESGVWFIAKYLMVEKNPHRPRAVGREIVPLSPSEAFDVLCKWHEADAIQRFFPGLLKKPVPNEPEKASRAIVEQRKADRIRGARAFAKLLVAGLQDGTMMTAVEIRDVLLEYERSLCVQKKEPQHGEELGLKGR
jgi:hypothetical protein